MDLVKGLTIAQAEAQHKNKERAWRDSELDRTDKFMSVSDYPYKEAMVAYRQTLRDWTDSEDFPTVRPTLEVGDE